MDRREADDSQPDYRESTGLATAEYHRRQKALMPEQLRAKPWSPDALAAHRAEMKALLQSLRLKVVEKR